MDVRSTLVGRKPPPARPLLITPSASPPGSRPAKSKKRPRFSETPSSSSGDPRNPFLESSSRLFSLWDRLAERYSRPLDEDDIIDLRDIELVKDRGVMRQSSRDYEIGCFADDDDSSHAGADDNAAGADEDDGLDTPDPLDFLSDPVAAEEPAVVTEKIEYYKRWYVPPVDENDPEDAQDFAEFEEAERVRRELYGDEEEEDSEAPLKRGTFQGDLAVAEEENERDDENAAVRSGDEAESLPPPPPPRTPRRGKSKPPRAVDPDSSEDEFAAWVIDDTPVPSSSRRDIKEDSPAPSAIPREVSVSVEDNVIEISYTPSPSPSARRSRSRPPLRKQPISRTPPKPPTPVRASSSAIKVVSRHPSPTPTTGWQLLTPPRSSSSAVSVLERTPIQAEDPVIPEDSPSPKLPLPRPRYKSKGLLSEDEALPLTDLSSSNPPPLPALDVVQAIRQTKRTPSRKPSIPTDICEVVVPMPKSRAIGSKPRVSAEVVSPDAAVVPEGQTKSYTSKDKGKGRANPQMTDTESVAPYGRWSTSLNVRSRSESESESPPKKPPRGRKRRRVSSTPSLPDAQLIAERSVPTLQRATRYSSSASFTSGYHSDQSPPTSSPTPSDDESGMWWYHWGANSILKVVAQKAVRVVANELVLRPGRRLLPYPIRILTLNPRCTRHRTLRSIRVEARVRIPMHHLPVCYHFRNSSARPFSTRYRT